MQQARKISVFYGAVFFVVMVAAFLLPAAAGQLQQSGGGGSNASVGTYPAAAPGSGTLAGGQFKTTPVTLTDGQMGAVMLDSSGNQKVAVQGTVTTSGTLTANQGGTWTVQPGNTANTTPWLVKQVPLHGCTSNTLQDITTVDVATGAGTAATSVDTCVFYVYVNNKTSSAVTFEIRDKSGTPIVYSTAFSVPGNSDVLRSFYGHKFLGGVQLIAGTATALNAVVYGVQ